MRASSRMLPGAVLAVLAGFAPSARAEIRPCVVDAKAQTLRCRGVALPPPTVSTLSQARGIAERSARLDAQRNLREALKGLALNGARTAGDESSGPKLEDTVRKAQVVDAQYFSDGGVAVELQLSLETAIPVTPLDAAGVTGTTASTNSSSDTVPVSAPETKVPGASQH